MRLQGKALSKKNCRKEKGKTKEKRKQSEKVGINDGKAEAALGKSRPGGGGVSPKFVWKRK